MRFVATYAMVLAILSVVLLNPNQCCAQERRDAGAARQILLRDPGIQAQLGGMKELKSWFDTTSIVGMSIAGLAGIGAGIAGIAGLTVGAPVLAVIAIGGVVAFAGSAGSYQLEMVIARLEGTSLIKPTATFVVKGVASGLIDQVASFAGDSGKVIKGAKDVVRAGLGMTGREKTGSKDSTSPVVLRSVSSERTGNDRASRFVMDQLVGPLADTTRRLPTAVSGLTRQVLGKSQQQASSGGPAQASPTEQVSGALQGTVTNNPATQIQNTAFSETVDGSVTVSTPGNVSSLNASFTGSADGSRTGILPGPVHATIGGSYQGSAPGAEADPGSGSVHLNISGSAKTINGQFVDQNAKLNITSPGFNVTGAGSGNFTINQSGGAAKGTFSGAAINSGGASVGSATVNYNSTLK